MIQKTPQEKKRLSYEKDCRNNYGENDKASRKAIHLRKRWVNRTYRRAVNQHLGIEKIQSEETADEAFTKVKETRRKDWKKEADISLRDYLRFKNNFKNR